MQVISETFSGLAAFADRVAEMNQELDNGCRSLRASGWDDSDSFYGCGYDEADRRAREGANEDDVQRVLSLVDKIEAEAPLTIDHPEFDTDVVGFLPCVPNLFNGTPETMYSLTERESTGGPLRIVVDVCCSGGVDVEDLANRGAAIAAFAYQASVTRPVELVAVAGMAEGKDSTQVPVVHLGVSPLDVPAIAYALSDASMLRRLCFGFANYHGNNSGFIRWGWHSKPHKKDYRQGISDLLGLTDDDILLHGGYLDDRVFENPTAWVRDMLAKHVHGGGV